MTHSGTVHAQLEKVFATINAPFLSAASLKKRECEAGVAIEDIAKTSCDAMVEEEVKGNCRY